MQNGRQYQVQKARCTKMADRLIQTSTLQGIADAIRGKDGTQADIQVSDFATRISAIPTGSDFYGDRFFDLIYGAPSEEEE